MVDLEARAKNKNGKDLICPICGKSFYRKQSIINKIKDINHLTCSKECCYKLRKQTFKGSNNHQFGIKGIENASWKSEERYGINNRYKIIRTPEHPFKDKEDFVPNYILVAEKYLLTSDNSIIINNVKYLNPKYVVHHIDFDKTNDNYTNLYIFPNKNLHILFHNLYRNNTIKNIEEFWCYYKTNYENKIYSYKWMYEAYVIYNLSANQICNFFNLPYHAIQKSIETFDLKKYKTKNNEVRINCIKNKLLTFNE